MALKANEYYTGVVDESTGIGETAFDPTIEDINKEKMIKCLYPKGCIADKACTGETCLLDNTEEITKDQHSIIIQGIMQFMDDIDTLAGE